MNRLNTLIGTPPFLQEKGSRMPFDLFGFECGDGWYDLIAECGAKIHAIDPSVRVEQVKEKFGTLRFYVSHYPAGVHEAVCEAEQRSAVTCEDCGAAGELRQGGWLRTLCDGCHVEWKNRKTWGAR